MKTKHCLKPCFIAGWILLLVFFTAEGTGALAWEKVDRNDLEAAVETWVRQWTPHARPDAVISYLEPLAKDGETWAYIARLQGGGYCLCGADTLVLPVYLYSPNGTYDSRNPGCRYVLDEIAARSKYLREGLARDDLELRPYRKALAERAADWSQLMRRRTPRARPGGRRMPGPAKMELELTCKWDQFSPYNDQCPNMSPGYDEHVLVGCNATAMVQMMYYWKWPSKGLGQETWNYDYRWRTIGSWDSEPLSFDPAIPPNWPVGYAGETKYARLRYDYVNKRLEMTGYWDWSLYEAAKKLNTNVTYLNTLATLYNRLTPDSDAYTVYPGNTTYDWSIMPDHCYDPPDPGDQEVAKLSMHAGCTIQSTWGIGGTGSNHAKQANALYHHFYYHSDARQQGCSANVMVDEIQWLRPVGMGGDNSEGGGHAWVIHGYDTNYSNWRFLMNFGWSGASDDWYTLDNLPGDFYINQSNLVQVAPIDVRFVGNSYSGDGSPYDPYMNIEDALTQAPDNTTLIFKAGSANTFAASTLVIKKPLVLKGYQVTIE